MARRRRNHGTRNFITFIFLTSIVAGGWWLYPAEPTQNPDVAPVDQPGVRLTTTRPADDVDSSMPPGVTEKGGTDASRSSPERPKASVSANEKIASLIEAGKQALTREDFIPARTHFSEAMQLGATGQDALFLRAELTRLGNATVFASRVVDGDPLASRYTIRPGDSLAKIAKKWNVSDDLLASVNNIPNKNMIRAGRSIKVIQGPFQAFVEKSTFSMDIYLGQTLVRSFKVGLGEEGGTPTGKWRVGTKLRNPTYYHPRGGDVVAADDPSNPLGECWIGLIGVSGEALGQERYGIHGTIEPETIGTNSSMGCIRMYNQDVEDIYTYLVENQSNVTIK